MLEARRSPTGGGEGTVECRGPRDVRPSAPCGGLVTVREVAGLQDLAAADLDLTGQTIETLACLAPPVDLCPDAARPRATLPSMIQPSPCRNTRRRRDGRSTNPKPLVKQAVYKLASRDRRRIEAVLAGVWIKSSAAGYGGCEPRKTLAFLRFAFVEKGHGGLFPQPASAVSCRWLRRGWPVRRSFSTARRRPLRHASSRGCRRPRRAIARRVPCGRPPPPSVPRPCG